MIAREFTADRINSVVNHPEIRPWVAPLSEGVLDLSPLVANENNVLLMGEHGGCLLMKLLPGVYEAHTQFLPSGRGAWGVLCAEAMMHHMYTATDCYEIMSRVPAGNMAASFLARYMVRHYGARLLFTRETENVTVYDQFLQHWVENAPGLIERGRWVHTRMHQEAERLGIDTPLHDDDENHNRHVGAGFEMMLAGQMIKGVMIYNRWALITRHPLIQMITADPPTIRFDLGLMRLVNDDIEVIRE